MELSVLRPCCQDEAEHAGSYYAKALFCLGTRSACGSDLPWLQQALQVTDRLLLPCRDLL